MSRIPKNIKYAVAGISVLIFLLLNSILGANLIVCLIKLTHKITGYHFGISTNTLDYLTFASIPIFGMILNSKRKEFKTLELVADIFKILFWVLLIIGIGLFILTLIGKSDNPLLPEYLISEPIQLYSTLMIAIGILIPFLYRKRDHEQVKN